MSSDPPGAAAGYSTARVSPPPGRADSLPIEPIPHGTQAPLQGLLLADREMGAQAQLKGGLADPPHLLFDFVKDLGRRSLPEPRLQLAHGVQQLGRLGAAGGAKSRSMCPSCRGEVAVARKR